MQYPLGKHHKDIIRSKTGKSPDEITIENVLNGQISSEDIKISAEVLKMQAQVALDNYKPQMAANFDRAAELVGIPDELILKIYNMLRPNRSTKQEMAETVELLREQYQAIECARLVAEAMVVYEKRGLLRRNRETGL